MTTSGSHPVDPSLVSNVPDRVPPREPDRLAHREPDRLAHREPDRLAHREAAVPTAGTRAINEAPAHQDMVVDEPVAPVLGMPQSRREATARQQERFGGMKIGAGFFGWLTATGAAVLLTALVVAVGAAVGVSAGTSLSDASNQVQQGTDTARTVGLAGGIALLVVLLVAYFAGGYVAGRMARFNGLRQGLAVWLWTLLIAVVVAVVAAVAGSKYNVLDNLNAFPRIPTGGNLTTGGIIALVAVAFISLVGALLGGLAGMRYHRRVDDAAFEPLTR